MFRPAVLYMLATAFSFSLMGLLVKIAGRTLPSQQIVFMRGLLTLGMSALMVKRERGKPLGTRRGLLVLRGVFGFVSLSCFYWSVCHVPMAEATVLQYTNPIFTAVIAAFVLGERLKPVVLASAALSMAGVLLVTRPASLFGHGAGLDPGGIAIALTGAISAASAYVTIRELSKTEDADVIVLYFPLVTVPLSVVPLWWGTVRPTASDWLVLLGVSLSTQVAQMCMTRAYALEKAGSTSAIGLSQVVFAMIWGVLFFDEHPDWRTLLGAALVVVGTVLVAATSGEPAGRDARGRATEA